MLCADGLAVARSSINVLTFGHSRAGILFLPWKCGHGTFKLESRNKGIRVAMFHQDNITLLLLEKPNVEVRREAKIFTLDITQNGNTDLRNNFDVKYTKYYLSLYVNYYIHSRGIIAILLKSQMHLRSKRYTG